MTGKKIKITVSRVYRQSAERVYDAWLEPALAKRFLFATPEGEMIRAEIDPRVGGKFLFIDRRKEGEAAHYGVYLELDRPRRIVFSFSVENYDVNAAKVVVEIRPAGGGCELTLTQEMPAEYAEYKDRSEKGWMMILGGLARELGE